MTEEIEIPFGAFDSETIGWTYTIPEGFTAKIEDGKIIVEKKESKDKQIIDALTKRIQDMYDNETAIYEGVQVSDILAWLKKQKEQKINHKGLHKGSLRHVDNPTKWMKEDDMEREQKPAEWSEEDKKFAYFVNQFLGYYEKTDPTAMSCKKWFNNRFKSLSPQPHWKPSEKQVGALKQWLQDKQYDGDSRYVYPILESLVSDLQKLL